MKYTELFTKNKSIHVKKILSIFSLKIIDKKLAMILLSLTAVHFFLLSSYFSNKHYLTNVPIEDKANQAIIQLIINAAQKMSPAELKENLTTITKAHWYVGGNRLDVSLGDLPLIVPKNYHDYYDETFGSKREFNNIFFQIYPDKWINYFEISTKDIYDYITMLVLLEAAAICFVLTYSWTLYRFINPLKKFKLSASRLGIDLATQPLITDGPSIVRETASAMNKMQKRIQNLVNTRTQMLAAISHDLRTNITRIQLRTELMPESEHSKKIIADLAEMEEMITDILLFAKNDVKNYKKVHLDLYALGLSIYYDFVDRNASVYLSTEKRKIQFFGCPLSLKRMITNLVENAIKHAGSAWIRILNDDKEVTIIVEDQGPGIPADELRLVLKPYYRAARSGYKAGSGLGLAIVQQVASFHSGKVYLRNKTTGGLEVRIVLPLHSNI